MTERDPVGDFYVHLVRSSSAGGVDEGLTSSNKLLALGGSSGSRRPTVIHFYDGG